MDATSKTGPALAPGSKFAGSLTAGGQRLAEALVTLKDQLAADKQDEPGSLALPFCRGEELSDLAPVRCGKGMRASMAYIVDDLKTLKDLTKGFSLLA